MKEKEKKYKWSLSSHNNRHQFVFFFQRNNFKKKLKEIWWRLLKSQKFPTLLSCQYVRFIFINVENKEKSTQRVFFSPGKYVYHKLQFVKEFENLDDSWEKERVISNSSKMLYETLE